MDIKRAAALGNTCIKDLFRNCVITDIRFEAAVPDNLNDRWEVTYSFMQNLPRAAQRVFKAMTIDGQTGDILAVEEKCRIE